MKNSLFNPPRSLRASIPPTENDLSYRKHLIQGEVHDQNAWAMGESQVMRVYFRRPGTSLSSRR